MKLACKKVALIKEMELKVETCTSWM